MNCNLTIDIGNSSTKLTLWHEGNPVAATRLASDLTAEDLALFIGGNAVHAIAYCSVKSEKDTPDIPALAKGLAGKIYRLDYVLPTPLVNDYSTAHTLGADRLAAACGAYSLYEGRDILIVDLGSAATYDHVSADGHFCGGNIAPGLGLRLKSLNEHTGRLPYLSVAEDTPNEIFALSTKDAIVNGCRRGIAAEILYYNNALPCGSIVILTGNDAAAIAPLLGDVDVRIDKDLVGRGLNNIIIYNEN